MKISNNKTYINKGPEGAPKRNVHAKWTQWLYFLFLVAVIVYIAYLVIRPYYVVEINGSIHVEQLTLSSPINATLTSLSTESGATINTEDSLITLTPTAVCNSDAERIKQEQDKLEKQQKVVYEQDINRAKRDRLQARLDALKTAEESPKARALELNASLFSTDESDKIEREKQELAIEIDYLTRLIALGTQQIKTIANEPVVVVDNTDCNLQIIKSPKAGQVSYIFKELGEYISRGDELINITPDNAAVAVILDLENDVVDSFLKNTSAKVFTVILPDGTESQAKVADAQSGRLMDLNSAIESSRSSQHSRVLLEPVDMNDSQRWISFAGTTVTIIGDK